MRLTWRSARALANNRWARRDEHGQVRGDEAAGIEASVGSRGDAYDNALAESVIGLFKTEVIRHAGPWRSLDDVEYATLAWVAWFNTCRLLEPLGYLPPAEYELQFERLSAAPRLLEHSTTESPTNPGRFSLHREVDPSRREHAERIAVRVVGWSFLTLAAYIVVDAGHALLVHDVPAKSLPGLIITVLSVIVMPVLARAKRRVAQALGSRALVADAKQTSLCAYLSVIVLAGLLLNALFGWWWADPVAALAMVPIIAKEGIEGARGERCEDGCRAD